MIRYIYCYCLFLAGFFCSCKKFVAIKPAPDLIETASIFQDQKTALAAVSGVYVQMRSLSGGFTNGGMSYYGGLYADELTTPVMNSTYDAFLQNALLPNTSAVNGSFWNLGYKNIYRTNAIIEGIAKSTAIPATVKDQLTGEMKLVRAFCYFYLVNLFGDVPLVTSTDYEVNALLPRTPIAKVYDQIITDLTDAEQMLAITYPSSGKSRPNKLTATALLARVYLYQGDMINASKKASDVIGAGIYQLKANLADVFTKESQETIWELASISEINNTDQGSLYLPSSATVLPTIVMTPSMLSVFEPNDKRRQQWVSSNTINGQTYSYPAKYKERLATTPVKEYNVVFRLPELILIRAEAKAQLADLIGAAQDLNMIRLRAGLPATTAIDKAALLIAIEKERQTELFSEWGDRWLNLKRTGHVNTVLSRLKAATWNPEDALFPIPQSELNYNQALVQNPGY